MTDVPERLIDVDFDASPNATGCLPRSDRLGASFPVFEDDPTIDLIPRSDWDRLIELSEEHPLDSQVQRIMDQGQEGSCASNASAQCMEVLFHLAFGTDGYVPLSAMSLYKRVASGPNSGSTIDGNLRELQRRGILPLSTPENRAKYKATMPHTGWSTPMPNNWEETAALFKAVEWFDVASFDGLATALFLGCPVCYGRTGHAICGVRMIKQSGGYVIRYANSWGNWGDNGYGYDTESAVSRAISSYGAWALRSVTTSDASLGV